MDGEEESMPKTRKSHPPSLKAKVAIEAIKAQRTTAQISQMFSVHRARWPWKKQAFSGLPDVFGIRVWTGTTVDPSLGLLAGFVLYCTIAVGTGAIAAYLNGSNFIKGQAVLVVISAVLNVALKLALCKYWDISGAIWGTNLAFLLVVIPAYFVIVPRLMREHAGRPRVPIA